MAEERHAFLADSRAVLRRLQTLLHDNTDLRPRFEAAKQVVRVFRKPAFYEIAQRCNLKCEGCYYFESGEHRDVLECQSPGEWERFFASEARRQVTMAYFVGAEPALEQERLFAASTQFPHGNIGTNGTIRIDPAIQFRIGVSVWAVDDASDNKLRGASAFRKAFRNYAGDPRVNILYTLTHWNLDGVRIVAEMCRDHGLPLTFNMYSPTVAYLDKLRSGRPNDNEFFRVSRNGDTPQFSGDDLQRARRIVSEVMDDFPDTVLYSSAYNDWATGTGPLYEIDPQTGIAVHCGSRMIGPMKYYKADLKPASSKCGTPDVDCSQCRMYSGGWSSKFQPSGHDVANRENFSDWLDMISVLGRIFVYDNSRYGGDVSDNSHHGSGSAAKAT